jgi:ribosomal protein S14
MIVTKVLLSRQKNWILLDNYKRQVYIKYKLKRILLKSGKITKKNPIFRKYLYYINLIKLPNVSSVSFSNNRCTSKGRIWGTNKKTSLGRFVLRQEIYASVIPGFRRASW